MHLTATFKRLRPARHEGRPALGQSLVEFALVLPLLLLLVLGGIDFGRVFYAYVAIEDDQEGAAAGRRAPLCDDNAAGWCATPTTLCGVENEFEAQGMRRNPDGASHVPTGTCKTPAGVARANLRELVEATSTKWWSTRSSC